MSTHSKLTLQGNFWDVNIYKNRLYLITYENELLVYNWSKLQESDIQEIDETSLEQYLIHRYEYKTDDLPSDICITGNKIYLSDNKGLHFLKTNDFHSDPLFKIWDNKSFSLNTNGFGKIAMSCGNEGLFELLPEDYYQYHRYSLPMIDRNIYCISKSHSTMTNYYNNKLYNFSSVNEAEFYLLHINRKLERFSEKDIFYKNEEQGFLENNPNDRKISWLHHNEIYRIINDREIEVTKIRVNRNLTTFEPSYIMTFQPWKGKILTGISSEFGVIVECEYALVISFSANQFLNIPGEVTKYRIYPHSKAYKNHLHVILDDRVEIYRFFKESYELI